MRPLSVEIQYREAIAEDFEAIARLHARSWQDHYRGIWPDEYLDNHVVQDRLNVWNERFSNPNDKQYAIVAESGQKMVGFACTFLDHDPKWGALLDNIHVLRSWQGKGIGKELFDKSLKWTFLQRPGSMFYLLVLVENVRAIQFYESVQGVRDEKLIFHNPDGSTSDVYRYVWTN